MIRWNEIFFITTYLTKCVNLDNESILYQHQINMMSVGIASGYLDAILHSVISSAFAALECKQWLPHKFLQDPAILRIYLSPYLFYLFWNFV